MIGLENTSFYTAKQMHFNLLTGGPVIKNKWDAYNLNPKNTKIINANNYEGLLRFIINIYDKKNNTLDLPKQEITKIKRYLGKIFQAQKEKKFTLEQYKKFKQKHNKTYLPLKNFYYELKDQQKSVESELQTLTEQLQEKLEISCKENLEKNYNLKNIQLDELVKNLQEVYHQLTTLHEIDQKEYSKVNQAEHNVNSKKDDLPTLTLNPHHFFRAHSAWESSISSKTPTSFEIPRHIFHVTSEDVGSETIRSLSPPPEIFHIKEEPHNKPSSLSHSDSVKENLSEAAGNMVNNSVITQRPPSITAI
ncbi:hypothetical protein DID76_04325 [Candidatus Marinamargulisbacteria bacterium SCGC AG-414-C22]|nr:hypothetical protein DID76_04325 [Candidatus Marinamargulisbacteria bacterium SCGC AG-414-C22]